MDQLRIGGVENMAYKFKFMLWIGGSLVLSLC
jgi:hypothetical protein